MLDMGKMGYVSCNRLPAAILIFSICAFAQARKSTAPPAPRKLIAVDANGSQRYQSPDIIAATGLRIGDVASEDDFNKATRDLVATGLFTDVAYTYTASGAGTRLEIKLADNNRLVPTHFENLVWFSDDDLMRELKKRVPLFRGQVPLDGNLVDQVSDALQAMLLENKSPGHVDYVRARQGDAPVDAVNYLVDNVALRIQNVKLQGASPEDAAALAPILEKFSGKDYARDALVSSANARLLPYYFKRGYLRAAFGPPQPKVQSQTEDEVTLDVDLSLNQGRAYTFAGDEWTGNKALSKDALQALIHSSPNQPADGVQLDSDLDAAAKLYATKGYVRAAVKPIPHFDDSKGTVSYDLEVHEGDLFNMGDLEIRGLDSRTTSQLQEAWSIRKGTPYDGSYCKKFVELAWKSLASHVDWTVEVHEAVDEREKVVDVSLVYGVRPSH
jgi:outer membrane protein assembly factor BamA